MPECAPGSRLTWCAACRVFGCKCRVFWMVQKIFSFFLFFIFCVFYSVKALFASLM